MCNCNKTIEGVAQVKAALQNKYKQCPKFHDSILGYADLSADFNDKPSTKLYYGIIEVGIGTEIDVIGIGGERIRISENSQIIKLFKSIAVNSGDNLEFRGWEIDITTSKL